MRIIGLASQAEMREYFMCGVTREATMALVASSRELGTTHERERRPSQLLRIRSVSQPNLTKPKPFPKALNPEPQTLNPNFPKALNPEPQTLNPNHLAKQSLSPPGCIKDTPRANLPRRALQGFNRRNPKP